MEPTTSCKVKMLYTVVITFKELFEERHILYKFTLTILQMHQDLFPLHIQTVYQSWSSFKIQALSFASLIFLTVCIPLNKLGEKPTESKNQDAIHATVITRKLLL
jgi:hypothetical protein